MITLIWIFLWNILLLGSRAERDVRDYFSTKRNYPIPPNGQPDLQFQTISQDDISSSHHQLVYIDIFSRHGTRNPTLERVKGCHELYHFISTHSNMAKLHPFLRTWSCPFKEQEAGELVEQGVQDMVHLGRRMKARYKDFNLDWESGLSRVYATNSSRVVHSCKSFLSGIMDADKIEHIPIRVIDRQVDYELSFYKSCPAYTRLHSQFECRECNTWSRTIFPLIIPLLESRTGLENITADHVLMMREMCLFENAIHGTLKGFCHYFQLKELEMLAYLDDLEYQEYFGYSYSLHRHMTCAFFTRLWHAIQASLHNKEPIVHLSFGHAETLIPLLVTLGLFHEPLLRADAPIEQRLQRQWLMSQLAPFAANLVFEIYLIDYEYYVYILHNEVPVTLPSCSLYCPLKQFQLVLMDLLDCDFEFMCKLD